MQFLIPTWFVLSRTVFSKSSCCVFSIGSVGFAPASCSRNKTWPHASPLLRTRFVVPLETFFPLKWNGMKGREYFSWNDHQVQKPDQFRAEHKLKCVVEGIVQMFLKH